MPYESQMVQKCSANTNAIRTLQIEGKTKVRFEFLISYIFSKDEELGSREGLARIKEMAVKNIQVIFLYSQG